MIIVGISIVIIAVYCYLGYCVHKIKIRHPTRFSDGERAPLLANDNSTRERDRSPTTGTKISQPAAKSGLKNIEEREMEESSQYSPDTAGDSSVGKVVQPPMTIPLPAKSESEKLAEREKQRLQQETEARSKCVAM